jgi:lactoylglutathione lyase
MFLRIDHVAINVADVEHSSRFYENHFGFRSYFQHSVPDGRHIAYLQLGDTVLELVESGASSIEGFHFCLETDDFDAAVQTLIQAGVGLIRAPHDTAARTPREQSWRRVLFRGPDGEQIELRG